MELNLFRLILITVIFLAIMIFVMYGIVITDKNRNNKPPFLETMQQHYWEGKRKIIPIILIIFYILAIILLINIKGIKL